MKKILLIIFLFLVACGDGNFNISDENQNSSVNTNISNITFSDYESRQGEDVCFSGLLGDGFLWKPESESDGNLVVLFPREFQDPFLAVIAETIEGESELGRLVGFTNGERQTWRFSQSGINYTGELIVNTNAESCNIAIENSGERNE